jgi:hypothetical protein
MRALWAAAVLLTACPLIAPCRDAMAVEIVTSAQPVAISPLAFARREPLPGQPSYLQLIKYIDDGMRYIDPLSLFFISPAGEMCFRTRPNYPQIIYEAFHRDWCVYPQTVDRVEAAPNVVRLWCMRAYPQCAHSSGVTDWIANSISVETVDYQQERAALESLINVMGGNVRSTQPSGASDGFR